MKSFSFEQYCIISLLALLFAVDFSVILCDHIGSLFTIIESACGSIGRPSWFAVVNHARFSWRIPEMWWHSPASFLLFHSLFHRTVAAEVRKQIAGQYGGSPQLFKNLNVGTAASNTVSRLQQQLEVWHGHSALARSSDRCPVTLLHASVDTFFLFQTLCLRLFLNGCF